MNQRLENICTMIGCNRKQFETIIDNNEGYISMSSGSYYSDFILFCDSKIIARYDHKGKLIYP